METFSIEERKGGRLAIVLHAFSAGAKIERRDLVVLGGAMAAWLREAAGGVPVADNGMLDDNSFAMRLAAFALAARAQKMPSRIDAAWKVAGNLPDECVLYWFGLCCFGRRVQAGRAAFRALCFTKE